MPKEPKDFRNDWEYIKYSLGWWRTYWPMFVLCLLFAGVAWGAFFILFVVGSFVDLGGWGLVTFVVLVLSSVLCWITFRHLKRTRT